MSEPIWKLLPPSFLRPVDVVWREWPDGRQESMLVTAQEFKNDILKGAELQDADGNVMSADEAKEFIKTLP